MKGPLGHLDRRDNIIHRFNNSFICLRLLYGRKYEQLMCFTAAARGGGSPEPSGHVTGKLQRSSVLRRLLILSSMIKVQNTTQLAGNDSNANNTVPRFDFYTRERLAALREAFHLITSVERE